MNRNRQNQHPLLQTVQQQKQGLAVGVYSICSANRFVLEASLLEAQRNSTHVYIESTSNQVNQDGGYTGMRPEQFATYVAQIARELKFPPERIILGGDHLGPNPWQDKNAAAAMDKAFVLIRDCVRAGYTKIHLDASMPLGDDPGDPHVPLAPDTIAQRAAQMCQVAEKAFRETDRKDPAPVYIIGTEVPIPGGAQSAEEGIHVTTVADAEKTIEINRQAFINLGLEDAWQRVCAVVVQPGVEFGDDTVDEYSRKKAAELSDYIESNEQFIYEAHSTDYQTPQKMKQMVEDHFAILKVGPWLTYACREAIIALETIEQDLLGSRSDIALSQYRNTLEQVMLDDPRYWKNYYQGDLQTQRLARLYSYSDRCRYYAPEKQIQKCLQQLISNLEKNPIPMSLISQYLPRQYDAIRAGSLKRNPVDLIRDKIRDVTRMYAYACKQCADWRA